jgi:hypothetical protein
MLLHLPALFEGQRAGLLEQAGREAYLADVMHEPTEMDEFLLILR